MNHIGIVPGSIGAWITGEVCLSLGQRELIEALVVRQFLHCLKTRVRIQAMKSHRRESAKLGIVREFEQNSF